MSIIRPAEYKDAYSLLVLAKQLASSFEVDEESFHHSLTKLLSDPAVYLAVAEEKNDVTGYIHGFDHYTFYANGRVAKIEEIVVRADCRRRGIGESLMKGFEEWARARKSRLVALATRRAAAFYTAIGYEESASYFKKLL